MTDALRRRVAGACKEGECVVRRAQRTSHNEGVSG